MNHLLTKMKPTLPTIDDETVRYKSAEQMFKNKTSISKEDIQKLPANQINRAMAIIKFNLDDLTGDERDAFIIQITPFLEESNNNSLVWERNKYVIKEAIVNHLQGAKGLPNISTISKKTGLSRPTVYKHLEFIQTDEFLLTENLKLKAIYSELVGVIGLNALQGDMKAAKLFLEIINVNPSVINATYINQQQNNLNLNVKG